MEALMELLEQGVSPVQAVQVLCRRLARAGYTQLNYGTAWDLKPGGKYYLPHHDTSLFAFVVPKTINVDNGMPPVRMAAAHTDFPCLKIKPSADVYSCGYRQLNTEVYGGAILNTWMDRPLGIAGRAAVRGENAFSPQICYFAPDRNLLTIPNLAIHMNREVNKGVELNRQTDLLPLLGLGEKEESDSFLQYLAKELGTVPEDILDFELTVYCRETPQYIGLKEEFLSASRLDNMTSCAALVEALTDAKETESVNLIAFFDHEEVGSRTKQGAGSDFLHRLVARILEACGQKARTEELLYRSMLLSVDVAHGLHPNQPGKTDITNKPILGGGLCIKEASAQTYATDCLAVAAVCQICESCKIPFQRFVNRSDMPGGSTLGSIASSFFPVPTVDVGVPILAMHSARELMCGKDQMALRDMLQSYFSYC